MKVSGRGAAPTQGTRGESQQTLLSTKGSVPVPVPVPFPPSLDTWCACVRGVSYGRI